MFISEATLIFLSFLKVIYAEEPTIYTDRSLNNEDDAAKVLVKIERNQVLPLVLHKESIYDDETLQTTRVVLVHPVAMLYAATLEGRMINGTEFLKYRGKTLYFCPKQDSEKTCLAPQHFQTNERLECAKEASPMIQVDKNQHFCGAGTIGIHHNVGYDICLNLREYVTSEIQFYSFCYSLHNKYTMYTSHIILSPPLLSTYLLSREHSMMYPITVNNEFKPLCLDKIEDEIISNLDLVNHPENSAYKLQTLVPVADMAMALWRKTTYQNFNLNWQQKELIPLWDKINEHVRKHAIKLFEKKIQIRVRTGVFEINSKPRDDGQMSNTWIKIVSIIPQDDSIQIEAVAILMNNFILPIASATGDSTKSSNKTEELEKKLCKEDSCIKSLQEEFRNVGGRISCCLVTQEIRNLFGFTSNMYEEPLPLFHIPGVNSVPSP